MKNKRFTIIKLKRYLTGDVLKHKFILIEFLTTIVVVGILVGISVPKFTNSIKNVKISNMIQDIEVL